MTIAILQAAALLYLGLVLPFFLFLLLLTNSLNYLLFIWVRFTLRDTQRALRWTAITAAVWPCASYLLCLAGSLLAGDSSGGLSFGLFGTYAVAFLAVATKEP